MGVGPLFGQEKNLGESIQQGNGSTRIVFSFARGSPYIVHKYMEWMHVCVCVYHPPQRSSQRLHMPNYKFFRSIFK
jgi:hypothetical protein